MFHLIWKQFRSKKNQAKNSEKKNDLQTICTNKTIKTFKKKPSLSVVTTNCVEEEKSSKNSFHWPKLSFSKIPEKFVSSKKNPNKSKMPNIKGRVNGFFQRQLTFVGSPTNGTSSNDPNLQLRPRRSHSFKENRTNNGRGSFINSYLNGQMNKHHPDIICGKTCYDLPVKEVHAISPHIIASSTGPNGGLTMVNTRQKLRPFELPADTDVDFIDEDYAESNYSIKSSASEKIMNTKNDTKLKHEFDDDDDDHYGDYHRSATLPLGEEIAGVNDWDRPKDFAFGIATTLYEGHPFTKEKAGEPIADTYAICSRENSAILALADGVNWGEKSCLASRSAIHGCMEYLNKAIYNEAGRIQNTMDIFVCLLRSFSAAHSLILEENGMLTTLTAAVVTQLKDSDRFIVCTCNVGDSLAYVYSREHGVREITQGSHDIFSMRDMRDALGALGPVDGQNPELNNLTVAMTIVDKGDIVFLTSDGISDNFDPVVGKFAMPFKTKPANSQFRSGKESNTKNDPKSNNSQKQRRSIETKKQKPDLRRSNSNPDRDSAMKILDPGLPVVTAQQRHELTLLRMEDVLRNGLNEGDTSCSSGKRLCQLLVDFSTKLTTAKRRVLEDPDLYDDKETSFNQFDQRQRRRKVGEKLAIVPGKLDHASVVAYKVGFYGDYAGRSFEIKEGDSNKYNLKLKATLAKFESQEDCTSLQ